MTEGLGPRRSNRWARGGGDAALESKTLRTSWLHYPGEGLHFIEPPPSGGHVWLNTPQASDQTFRVSDPARGSSSTLTGRDTQRPYGYPSASTDLYFRGRVTGRGRFSIGPVLLYADLFIARRTELSGIAAAFASTYPATPPPMALDRRSLIDGYVMNIYPIPLDTASRSVGLWSDLIAHGLGQLAETIVLAAQDRSYRQATGQPAPPSDRRTLVQRVRALATPEVSLPGSPSGVRRAGT